MISSDVLTIYPAAAPLTTSAVTFKQRLIIYRVETCDVFQEGGQHRMSCGIDLSGGSPFT